MPTENEDKKESQPSEIRDFLKAATITLFFLFLMRLIVALLLSRLPGQLQ